MDYFRACGRCGADISMRNKNARFCAPCTAAFKKKPSSRQCSEEDCTGPVVGHGLCGKHYAAERRRNGPFRRLTPQERFWAKVDKHGPVPACCPDLGPCWIWQGKPKREGYGEFYYQGAPKYAHRLSYEWSVRPIPPGLHIDHLCRVRICVNPGHLEPVTTLENTTRGDGPRLTSERGRAKTHCKHGHEFTEANTYWYQGRRMCKTCMSDRQKVAMERQKAERHARGLKLPTPQPVCGWGHPMVPPNLRVNSAGRRRCGACHVRHAQEARARKLHANTQR